MGSAPAVETHGKQDQGDAAEGDEVPETPSSLRLPRCDLVGVHVELSAS